jgi:predicted metalloprotease with PDZ domain
VGEANSSAAYREFLGLCTHEYFHAWLVKRIRPAAFMANDVGRLPLGGEAYTRLLWLFEGVTSYYDDLLLARAGLITAQDYLDTLAATMSRVQRAPGRLRLSLEHASLTAWTRLYKADENTANASISYYTKGALFAWVLDVEIRRRSADRLSLDDVLRALWLDFGRSAVGVPEDGFEAWLGARFALDLGDVFSAGLRGCDDLPLDVTADACGLSLHWGSERDAPWLGADVRAGAHGEAVLGTVYTGSAAEQAGLAPRDVLLALDGLRVDSAGLDSLLRRYPLGARLRVHAFRRDELLETTLCVQAPEQSRARLSLDPAPVESTAARCRHWLSLN